MKLSLEYSPNMKRNILEGSFLSGVLNKFEVNTVQMSIWVVSDDSWFNIWNHLTYHDVLSLVQTCHHFYKQVTLMKFNIFWKTQCRILLYDMEPYYTPTNWFKFFIEACKFVHKLHDITYLERELNMIERRTHRVRATCKIDCQRILKMYLSNPNNHVAQTLHPYNPERLTNIIQNGDLISTAIYYGSSNCLKYLVENFLCHVDSMAIECCILSTLKNSRHVNAHGTCRYLIKFLCNHNQLTTDMINGQYWLHYACKHQDCDMIQLLADKGADLMIFDHNGHSPLAFACKCKYYRVIRLLLQIAAKKENVGKKMLEFAAKHGCIPQCIRTIFFWLAKNDDSKMLEHILRVAIETRLIDVSQNEHKILAEKGNVAYDEEYCPLMVAIHWNYIDVAKCLISKFNIDVNRFDSNQVS